MHPRLTSDRSAVTGATRKTPESARSRKPNPASTFPHLYAYVWIKPPGESDGTYPAFSGTGDPHCDPNGTQTDGSGNTYPTDAIPDSPPAGHWFPVEFTQLVQDAYPAITP